MDNSLQSYTEILGNHSKLRELQYEHWINYELFTLPWWALAILLFVAWGVGWYFVDKKRITNMFTYGLFVLLISTSMDAIGTSKQLWIYPIQFIWFVPHMIPLDFGFLPVLYMLVYQYFSAWKPFLWATVIMSLFLAFMCEPLAEWVGIYHPYQWEHWWSFIIYIAIAIFNKSTVDNIAFLQKKSSNSNH